MNFRKGRFREEPEINFVPLIDVLLVILIFVMATTTYSKFSELKINLPDADAEQQSKKTKEINVGVDAGGRIAINKQVVNIVGGVPSLSAALKAAAQGAPDSVVIINADAQATHQSVINIMEAARMAQLTQITFATQTANKPK
jgi:biopolymer transport protein ExbD